MGRKSRRRSTSAKKGWNTRTRRQGISQVGKAVIGRSSPLLSTLRFVKDFTIGTYKVTSPRNYRRNKMLKKVDKYV